MELLSQREQTFLKPLIPIADSEIQTRDKSSVKDRQCSEETCLCILSLGSGFGHYVCGQFIALFLKRINTPRSPSIMKFSGASAQEGIHQLDQNAKNSESENSPSES